MKVILTGATGMVGEGVLLECLEHPSVERVLLVGRKPCGLEHPKVQECLVKDFMSLEGVTDQLSGYDACFYCAGISSAGMSEADYVRVTYDTPLHFADTLAKLNPEMVFVHISGRSTDSTEKGSIMWARVKGKAENALLKLPFKRVYNLRPGLMKPTAGQRNAKLPFRILGGMFPVLSAVIPSVTCTMREVGLAMIHCVLKPPTLQTLEVSDIKALAAA